MEVFGEIVGFVEVYSEIGCCYVVVDLFEQFCKFLVDEFDYCCEVCNLVLLCDFVENWL